MLCQDAVSGLMNAQALVFTSATTQQWLLGSPAQVSTASCLQSLHSSFQLFIGAPVYALDWLGMGRSSRPPFRITAKRSDTFNRVTQAESFFLDSLEEWRAKQGLQKMTLVGHSLGAYLAAAYAERHPDRVSKLVLLSPAGILGDPDAAQPSRELTDEQGEMTQAIESENSTANASPESSESGHGRERGSGSKWRRNANDESVKKVRAEQKERRDKETMMRKVLTYLWEEGVSPFQLVRSMTVFGPLFVGRVCPFSAQT